jgi:Zn-dependent M28 family amino/carboxypeptidase
MQIVTRSAMKRVGIVAVVGALVVAGCWWMMVRMPLRSFAGALPELTKEQRVMAEELRRDVTKLAGEIGERNVYKQRQLKEAAEYIEGVFRKSGLAVKRQAFVAQGETCENLEAEIAGTTRSNEIVVVGAHYDSVFNCPGANDNGSGVAGVLALARVWAKQPTARTLRFVAFVNEEPPFFQTEQMGSLVYAKACRARGDNIVAMLSLETMGYFDSAKGSQKYPFPVGMFYPSRGDFIAFVGSTRSKDLVRSCIKTFREKVSFPSEGAALPGALPGIGWSDHWSFEQVGYQAIMVTDTAPFRYPHYHRATDLPDKIDFERLARVVDGLRPVIDSLVNPAQ